MNELKKKRKKKLKPRGNVSRRGHKTRLNVITKYIYIKKKKILTHPQKYEAWNYNNNTRLKCIYKKKKTISPILQSLNIIGKKNIHLIQVSLFYFFFPKCMSYAIIYYNHHYILTYTHIHKSTTLDYTVYLRLHGRF